jgi:hypothetical protein
MAGTSMLKKGSGDSDEMKFFIFVKKNKKVQVSKEIFER